MIIIVQSLLDELEVVQKSIAGKFPELAKEIVYNSNFESTLDLIPKDEEVIVITSNFFHDSQDIKYSGSEKSGNRLAQLIKEINPTAEVYVFAETEPRGSYINDFYKKKEYGDLGEEIIEAMHRFCIV